MKNLRLLILFALIAAMGFVGSSALANISGAIFTTDGSCIGVNVNQFDSKMDVYLDGGPHGKGGAAGLPNGNYDVQVTAPNGDPLGSTFGTAPVHVTNGNFDDCYQLWAILKKAGNPAQNGYDDTPNNGGVYKVWVTQNYTEGQGVNGFIHSASKTDNFKVGPGTSECPTPSVIKVRKFDDSNANGIKDDGEAEIEWSIDVTDPLGSVITKTAPFDDLLASPAGIWQICEDITDTTWRQTALIVDGDPCDPVACAMVNVSSDCGEVHEVIFGNVQLGSIEACKFIDSDVDGEKDPDEQPLAGVKFTLNGTVNGTPIVPQEKTTGEDGCVTFDGLLPGSYTLCEVLPPNWTATTDICKTVELSEGDNPSFSFGNVCTGTADFDTKGYWHNKNGLNETVQADFDYLNTLAPWLTPSSYFDAGDEPIDGKFSNGNPIPAARDASRKVIALAGTAKAEQSYFLIDKNSGGDPREQLAQQLDAFIMNVRHRLTECGPDSMIQKPDGTWVSALGLIEQAVNVWNSGSASERTTMSTLLDALNNSSAVVFIQCTPCEVTYPVVD